MRRASAGRWRRRGRASCRTSSRMCTRRASAWEAGSTCPSTMFPGSCRIRPSSSTRNMPVDLASSRRRPLATDWRRGLIGDFDADGSVASVYTKNPSVTSAAPLPSDANEERDWLAMNVAQVRWLPPQA